MGSLRKIAIMCLVFFKFSSNLLSFRIKHSHRNNAQRHFAKTSEVQQDITTTTTTPIDWISSFCENFFLQGAAQKDYLKCANRRYQLENKGIRMPQIMYDKLKSTLSPSILSSQDNNTVNAIVFPSFSNDLHLNEEHSRLSFKSNNERKLQFNTTYIPSTIPPSSSSNYLDSTNRYDVAIMPHYLSQLSTPEQRMEWIQQIRQHLLNPGGSSSPSSASSYSSTSTTATTSLPHRVGLLIIIEKNDEFNMTSVSSSSNKSSSSSKSRKHSLSSTGSASSTTSTSVSTVHDLLNDWRQSIKKCGFELVKQRILSVDDDGDMANDNNDNKGGIAASTESGSSNRNTQMLQAFVFKTSNDVLLNSSNSNKHRPWLARDFKVSSSVPESVSLPLQTNILQHSTDTSRSQSTSKIHSNSQSSPSTTTIKTQTIKPTSSSLLPVGIVGGGLGGTALALALQRRNIPVKLYEKDVSFAHRKQGYALTIQQGAIALRMLGVMEEVAQCGCLSLAHVSLTATGNVIGAYGVSEKNKNDNSNDNNNDNDRSSDDSTNIHTRSNQTVVHNVRTVSAEEYTHLNNTGHIINKQATLNRDPLKRHNIHIPRQVLREIMLKHIHPTSIQWNTKLVCFQQQEKGEGEEGKNKKVTLCFDDGSKEYVSILVAADGIHSLTRKQLDKQQQRQQLISPDSTSSETVSTTSANTISSFPDCSQLNYLGLIVILGISNTIVLCDNIIQSPSSASSGSNSKGHDNSAATAVVMSGRHQVQWVDGTTRVFTMPYDDNNTMWQLSFPMAETEATSVTNQASVLKQLALNRLKGWHQPLVEMIEATVEDCISGHPAYDRHPYQPNNNNSNSNNNATSICDNSNNDRAMMTPTLQQQSSASSSRVTLLGDAAHPMSPFKGQGANQALLDALALSKALVFSDIVNPTRRPVSEALREYESDMWERSAVKVLKSRSAAVYLHSDVALAKGNITRAAAAEMANIKSVVS